MTSPHGEALLAEPAAWARDAVRGTIQKYSGRNQTLYRCVNPVSERCLQAVPMRGMNDTMICVSHHQSDNIWEICIPYTLMGCQHSTAAAAQQAPSF